MDSLHHLAETIVFLSLIIVTCGSLIARFAFGAHQVKRDLNHTPSVTILLSCFNEGESVYLTIKSAIESNYEQQKLFVVAIDDCSRDDSWMWMQKAASEFTNVLAIKNEHNLGKPKSLLKALEQAKTELIICIDGDGALHKDAIAELSACFIDPTVGAVGGTVMVRNPDVNWLSQLQTLQYNTIFQISKIGESFSGSINCISGALFAVRRAIYNEIVPEIKARTWAGLEVKDGEDRFMTNLILMRGWKTIMNPQAKVYTDVPTTISQFFSQQLRWRRGIVRLFLWSLQSTVVFGMMRSITPVALVKFYMLCFVLMLWPVFIIWLLISGGIIGFITMKFGLLIISMSIAAFALVISKLDGNSIHVGPLAFFITPIWLIIDMFFLTIMAMLTLTSVSWETRQ